MRFLKNEIFIKYIFLFLVYNFANADNNLKFYIDAAFKNNFKLNAERKTINLLKKI